MSAVATLIIQPKEDKRRKRKNCHPSCFVGIPSCYCAFHRKYAALNALLIENGIREGESSWEKKMKSVVLKDVAKHYRLGSVSVPALQDINLEILSNRFTVISGPSGSGKTTLLNLIGCIDRPDKGEITVVGETVQNLSDHALSDFRARRVGFVFQNFNLLPVLSAYENVEYPLILAKKRASVRRKRVLELLEAVGLMDKVRHRPGQLSGGQRQRVAIARALATAPDLVLADEPTANLDRQTGADIISLMRRMQREHQVSFVFSSHDAQVMAEADDAVTIEDGCITKVDCRTPQLQELPT